MLRAIIAGLLSGLIVGAAPALAAAPPSDGELAVQPAKGAGIVLVGPGGADPTRICTSRPLCGVPVAPRFAPDGRGIVFGQRGGGPVEIVSPDGTCLWCRLGPGRLPSGSAPAFADDGAVTSLSGDQVITTSLTGGHRQVRLVPGVSAAVPSASGELAIVRGGTIDIPAARGGLRAVAHGSSPAWSPDGSTLAFTRGGWVRSVSLRSAGVTRRLVRGRSPAFSPDGRLLAFIAPNGAVSTINATGGDRRTVGSLRGRNVAWGVAPTTDPCDQLPGRVIAHTTDGVVRERSPEQAGGPHLIVTGCLPLTGVAHRLLDVPDNGGDVDADVLGASTGGRFAMLDVFGSSSQSIGICGESVLGVDLASGADSDVGPTGVQSQCSAPDIGSPQVDSSGFFAWTLTTDQSDLGQISGISCIEGPLCVAVASPYAKVFASTDPGSSAPWTSSTLSGPAALSVACASPGLCVAGTTGGVYSSTDPTRGAVAWSFDRLQPDHTLRVTSCGADGFCAAIPTDFSFRLDHGPPNLVPPPLLYVSADPAGGSTAWRVDHLPLPGVSVASCPSSSFCVAGTPSGELAVSGDPDAPTPTWTTTGVPIPSLTALDCPTASECVALGTSNGNPVVEASADPGAGPGAWSQTTLTGISSAIGSQSLSCLPSGPCVATLPGGSAASSDPLEGAPWTSLGPESAGAAVSCASQTLCAIASGADVATSSTPVSGPYSSLPVAAAPCVLAGTDCTTESLQVHDDTGTRTADPGTAGATTAIGHVSLSGNATTVTWQNAGVPHSLALR